jgi:choline-sulfatase
MNMKKNVIVISSDEMRADCTGFMGNMDIKTPNLDEFAKKGVVFEKQFTAFGKCLPSRVSMQTGRYSHTDGFRTVDGENLIPEKDPNMMGLLKKNGYETAVFGLNHAWEKMFASNEPFKAYVDYHSWTGEYKDWWKAGKRSEVDPEYKMPEDLNELYCDYKGKLKDHHNDDDMHTKIAIDYLKNKRDRTRPFYLHINLGAPHPAYKCGEPFFSMYDRKKIKTFPHELPENAPLHMRKMRELRTGNDISDGSLTEMQAVYYGMITKVDLQIGEILKEIERQGLFKDSIVMFWVDHGDFASQYGLPEKWDTCMADCLLNVPYILYSPELPAGKRVKSMTEHVDIAPTVLELLGITPDWGIHGESLLPIIEGKKKKEAVFADGGHEEEMFGRVHEYVKDKTKPKNGKQRTYNMFPETMSRTKMIRTDKWKMVIRLKGGNELYHLEKDPNELKNLWGKPEYDGVVKDLQQKLIEWCLKTDTDRPYQSKVYA